jgi:hypothetical protein
MRCYFMKGGHIAAVELLEETDDAARIRRARELFGTKGKDIGAEGFEVWDGPRFVFRFPANLQTPHSPDAG